MHETKPVRVGAMPTNVRNEVESVYAEKVLNNVGVAARRMLRLVDPVTATYSLGPRGASMLTLIDRGAVHPTQLSEIYEVGRSLITAEVSRLIAAGLVVRDEFEHDKRRATLRLTALGKQVSDECFAAFTQAVQSSLGHYGQKQRTLFIQMLEDLGRVIS